ncbi:hypothetical protein [Paraburkholderia sp. C35]|nr:hypothetical protein [Paraburkholderia sp. C35]
MERNTETACDGPYSIADQVLETAGVVLAAVFTVIAGVGTVMQFVAIFR